MLTANSRYFRASLLSSLIVIFAAASQAQNFSSTGTDNMPVFAPAGENFSVRFPGKPERSTEASRTFYTVSENGHFFGMAIETSTEIERFSVEESLIREITGFTNGFKGQVISQYKTVDVKGGMIKAVVESGDQQALVAAYRLKGRTYTVAFAMRKGDKYPPEAYAFLNSFKISQ